MDHSVAINAWVESYLDALVSRGQRDPRALDASGGFDGVDVEKDVYAKYFVNQILGLDEASLWQAWSKASSTKRPGARDFRLAYLTWRVWSMKQMRGCSRASPRPPIDDDADADAAEMAPDSAPEDEPADEREVDCEEEGGESEEGGRGEGGPALAVLEAVDLWEHRVDRLYIVLVSMHGLVRGEDLELGRDPDTGGQVKYVVELAKALAEHPAVHRVDLLTRLVADPNVDAAYSAQEEPMLCTRGGHGGAFLVRIPCGPPKKYLRKESLWPYIQEFADNGVDHVKRVLGSMADAGEPCELYAVHGHYADAAEAAALMAHVVGATMVLTGHSLGRSKLVHLLRSGMTRKEAESTYAIGRRVEAEETGLDAATLVLTSTRQEIEDQWGLYDGYEVELQAAINGRIHKGRHMPVMRVIPPGLDFSNLKVDLPPHSNGSSTSDIANNACGSPKLENGTLNLDRASSGASTVSFNSGTPKSMAERPQIWQEAYRFLRNHGKPVVLAMSRPDAKKNIATLVKAFGSNAVLRELANLVLIMGNRDSIDTMAPGSATVLEEVLKLIDAYDLYGSVAYPKHHGQDDISDIYRLAAATRGVFTNVALQECFGLTLIEAAAHGVPIVATKHGGPVDIVSALQNGILVDPTDASEVSGALLKIVTTPALWDTYSRSGLAHILTYSWPSHCRQYLAGIEGEKRRRARKLNIAAFSGSWDGRTFERQCRAAEGGGLDMGAPGRSWDGTSLMDDHAIDRDPDGRLASEARGGARPRLASRDAVVMFVIDDSETSGAGIELLKREIGKRGRGEGGAGGVGFGVATMMGYCALCERLEDGGLAPGDVDFAVCNAGADAFLAAGGEEMASCGAYEAHVDGSPWDKTTVRRVLERIPAGVASHRARLLKCAGGGTGPCHLVMDLHPTVKPTRLVVEGIRKRLRQQGIRSQVALWGGHAGETAARVHVTPLRASRSLAVRFLMARLGISMARATVVCFPSAMAAEGESLRVGLAASDARAMVAGSQAVVLVPPGGGGAGEGRVVEEFEAGRVLYGDRVVVADGSLSIVSASRA
eukprot:evm.model.scf_2113.2 EVM.evm.TU.scf_2113.2   scf_2113:13778-22052(-)